MTGNLSSLRVYDGSPLATATAGNDPTSVKDLSQSFLHMLTVQLRNQDPMAPMDNAAMTAQLAQLNMVDGINRLNTSMTAMMNQMKAASLIGMSSAVGRMALVPADSYEFSGSPVRLAAALPKSVAKIELTVYDASNRQVDQVDMGSHQAGTVDLVWDGKDGAGQPLPAGQYRAVWSASDADGRLVFPSAHAPVRVSALGAETVDLADGRQLGIEQILKWLDA